MDGARLVHAVHRCYRSTGSCARLVHASVSSGRQAASWSWGSWSAIVARRRSRSCAGEGPLERPGDLAVVVAEGEQPLGERVERVEVVRGKRFALDDREVQLDLVEPGGVDRQVDQPGVRPGLLHPLDRGRCRHASCRCRRSSRRCGPRRRARRSSPARRGGRTARSRSWARRGRTGWRGGRPSRPGRRACRCGGTRTRPAGGRPGAGGSVAWRRPSACSCDFSSAQITYSSGRSRRPSKRALVEVEHPAGLLGEARVADEDPGALLPRLQRVVVQPTPDRRRRRVTQAALDDQPVQLSAREAAERQAVRRRQLARERLHLGDLLRGENGAGDPRAA